ncbi:MAG: GMC oxidoreductase [Cyanobacteria bacterium P01_E01_bin.35]
MPDRSSIYRPFVEDDAAKLSQDIETVEQVKQQAIRCINEFLDKDESCNFGYFIQDQPSLLLAPEISNTVQVFNLPIRPSSTLGFPNRNDTKCLISSSTELFNLMGLISFNLDGIARDDVEFLADQLQIREFIPLLHKTFFGGHFSPQGIQMENLASCIDLILQELRQRQRQGIAKPVQCMQELSCDREVEIDPDKQYDLIVVGSGNGACGFLSKYLEQCPPESKILVLESGKSFFETSDITHQNNWTKSYSEGDIFQLHNAQTKDGLPIVSGRANTMGGGGSINYAMIHESSSWLSKHFGHSEQYWDELKQNLNRRLNCLDPFDLQTELNEEIIKSLQTAGFTPPNPSHHSEKIPSYDDSPSSNCQQLYLFSTQFNSFGQRTHSGVSIVDWERIDLRTQCQVTQLKFRQDPTGDFYCQAVQAKCLTTGKTSYFLLKDTGKVMLCAGAATPRLLMPHKQKLNNNQIGQHVNDHIIIPIGIYLLNQDVSVISKDVYVPLFAKTVLPTQTDDGENSVVGSLEFFAGNFEKLWFYITHLYLAYVLPNCLKSIVLRSPYLFPIYKLLGVYLEKLNLNFNLWESVNLITASVKFNSATEGQYDNENKRITLGFFESDKDKQVAEMAIKQLLPLMEKLGRQPHPIIRFFLRGYGLPYEADQVKKYIDKYSRKYLVSQQHLAGGCLFGKAIDKGLENHQNTGKVIGSSNVYVANLSASPLPRVSTQMTAYLIGFHVASQLNRSDN